MHTIVALAPSVLAVLAGLAGAALLQRWLIARRRASLAEGKLQYRFCPNCGHLLEKRLIEEHEKLACPSCSFVYWNNPTVVGAALIPFGEEGRDGIVLVKRGVEPKKGLWALPAGHGEPFEHPELTSKRESGEEATLDIEIESLLAVDAPPNVNQVLIFYLAKPVRQLPRPGSDALDARVFKLDDFPRLPSRHTYV